MNFNNEYDKVGLGLSGESYLVGKDLNMRSNSRFISNIDTPDVKMLGTTIGSYNIKSAASSAAISGKTDTTLSAAGNEWGRSPSAPETASGGDGNTSNSRYINCYYSFNIFIYHSKTNSIKT